MSAPDFGERMSLVRSRYICARARAKAHCGARGQPRVRVQDAANKATADAKIAAATADDTRADKAQAAAEAAKASNFRTPERGGTAAGGKYYGFVEEEDAGGRGRLEERARSREQGEERIQERRKMEGGSK